MRGTAECCIPDGGGACAARLRCCRQASSSASCRPCRVRQFRIGAADHFPGHDDLAVAELCLRTLGWPGRPVVGRQGPAWRPHARWQNARSAAEPHPEASALCRSAAACRSAIVPHLEASASRWSAAVPLPALTGAASALAPAAVGRRRADTSARLALRQSVVAP